MGVLSISGVAGAMIAYPLVNPSMTTQRLGADPTDPASYPEGPASDFLCNAERVAIDRSATSIKAFRISGLALGQRINPELYEQAPRIKPDHQALHTFRENSNWETQVFTGGDDGIVLGLRRYSDESGHNVADAKRLYGQPSTIWRSRSPACPWSYRLVYNSPQVRDLHPSEIDMATVCTAVDQCRAPGMPVCGSDPSFSAASVFVQKRTKSLRVEIYDYGAIAVAVPKPRPTNPNACNPFSSAISE